PAWSCTSARSCPHWREAPGASRRLGAMTDETVGASSRPQTEIDRIAEDYVHRAAAMNPEINVWTGIEGDKAGYGDYSPAGREAMAGLARDVLAQLEAARPADDIDWVTKTDLARELQLE